MNKISLVFLSFLLINTNLLGQYQPTGLYLTEPDRLIGYVDSCAQFWVGVKDATNGGFYMDVDRQGQVFNTSTKNVVSQSRDAYGFTRAFMMTGNEEYLDLAQSALDFMSTYHWDSQYGGWFNRCNSDGSNPSTGDSKSAFDQHYALLGPMAHMEATGDTASWKLIEQGMAFNEQYLWDQREDYLGYYDYVSRDGSNANAKSFNATVDAITTHLYNLYLLTGDKKYFDRLIELKDNILDYLVASMDDQVIGFSELYFSDWSIDPSQPRTIMGHVLKTAWCMARIQRIDPQSEILDAAKALALDVWDKGYDHEFGGPYKDYDRNTGKMYMYGAVDTAKAWWQMEQAVMAGLLMYEITNEDWYLQMADESLEFFRKYFVDHIYSEVYADRSRSGGRVSYGSGYWDENKGSAWKAAYHSIETGYYAYLYSSLLFNNHVATLYYRYDQVPYERQIRMNPLAVYSAQLDILEVVHADTSYTLFDPITRVLTIPENVSGVFAVTYFYNYPHTIAYEATTHPETFQLLGNYPNPFNNFTTISFALSQPERVQLDVFDIHGRKMSTLIETDFTSGEHKINWHADRVGSGIYFYRLQVNGQIKTGKMTLIK